MCQLLAPVFQGFFILLQPLTLQMKQTSQAVRAIRQSILLRCLLKTMTATTLSFLHKLLWVTIIDI
jgi:hypothetical protein